MTPAIIREKLRHILHLDETPHELAKAFAVGVFVAFTPTLGFHTATVLVLAWALKLNKAVALTGTFVNNPWTIAFIFLGPTWAMVIALRYLGVEVPPFNYDALVEHFNWVRETYKAWQPDFWRAVFGQLTPYLAAFFLGTTLAGVFAAVAAYFVMFAGIVFYRKEKEKLRKVKEHA